MGGPVNPAKGFEGALLAAFSGDEIRMTCVQPPDTFPSLGVRAAACNATHDIAKAFLYVCQRRAL